MPVTQAPGPADVVGAAVDEPDGAGEADPAAVGTTVGLGLVAGTDGPTVGTAVAPELQAPRASSTARVARDARLADRIGDVGDGIDVPLIRD
jgi:hypothetical protein